MSGKPGYIVETTLPATTNTPDVILELSLSDAIDSGSIEEIMGSTKPKYRISIPKPNRDYLKSRDQLVAFCEEYRCLLTRIMGDAGKGCTIHLFPAIPVSVAVEIGRMVLPKSDVKIEVYDFNNAVGGWRRALTL